MAARLREHCKGVVASTAMGVNTLVCTSILFLVATGKFIVPSQRARNAVRRWLAGIAEVWIGFNNRILTGYRSTEWELHVPAQLDREGSYIVNCNHQSWVDILVLQRAFNRRAPFMRFFIKRQLIWVPVLGFAWWALDFPFMRRYSRDQIARKPTLKDRDLETARRVCARLREIPVAIMNFLEGTRFSELKRTAQNSPYRYLLKPRIGGLGEALYVLGDKLRSVVDVTIVYPDGVPSFWDLVCGRVSRIVVMAREVAIPESIRGKHFRSDSAVRAELEAWAERLWTEKDRLVAAIRQGRRPATLSG